MEKAIQVLNYLLCGPVQDQEHLQLRKDIVARLNQMQEHMGNNVRLVLGESGLVRVLEDGISIDAEILSIDRE